jgi:hypothetical protein
MKIRHFEDMDTHFIELKAGGVADRIAGRISP